MMQPLKSSITTAIPPDIRAAIAKQPFARITAKSHYGGFEAEYVFKHGNLVSSRAVPGTEEQRLFRVMVTDGDCKIHWAGEVHR